MSVSAPLQCKDVPGANAGEKFPRGSLFLDGRLPRAMLLGLPRDGWFGVGFGVDRVKCRKIISGNRKASGKGEIESHCIRAQSHLERVLLVC